MGAAKDRLLRLKAHTLEAHDALHVGEVDRAHECLHRALGGEDPTDHGLRLAAGSSFDEDFRALLAKHKAVAAYVRLSAERVGNDNVRVAVGTGGEANLCGRLDQVIRGNGEVVLLGAIYDGAAPPLEEAPRG